MDLIRRVYVEERPKPGERYLSEAELREEFFRPVPYYFGREYSKLEAIERISRKVIASDTMLSEKVRRQLIRETRWLLVDQGLLFAQTRARHYPDDKYPEKRFGQRTKINQTLLKNRKEVLRTEKKRNESYLESRIKALVQRAKRINREECGMLSEVFDPEVMFTGLTDIMKAAKGSPEPVTKIQIQLPKIPLNPECLRHLSERRAVNWMKQIESHFSGELSDLSLWPIGVEDELRTQVFRMLQDQADGTNTKQEREEEWEQKCQRYLAYIQIGLDKRGATPVGELLSEGDAITKIVFLWLVLTPYLKDEKSTRQLEGRDETEIDYLAFGQLEAYHKMVQRYYTWKKTTWEIAEPALHEYLYPWNLWKGRKFSFPLVGGKIDIEQVEKEFEQAFGKYLKDTQLHRKNKEDSRSEGEIRVSTDCQEGQRGRLEESAEVLAQQCAQNSLSQNERRQGDAFYLMQHPGLIFHLLRSPQCLMDIVHAESRKRPFFEVAERACTSGCVPVTAQTWHLDKPLLQKIIKACKQGCQLLGLPFNWKAWQAFVKCLEQCVESVSFNVEVLYGLHGVWKNLLRFSLEDFRQIYRPLDLLLHKRYDGEDASGYLRALWRILQAKPELGEAWRRAADIYRPQFQNPATETEDIRVTLDRIPPFGWNYISLNLREEECIFLRKELPKHLATKVIAQINAPVKDQHTIEKTALAGAGGVRPKRERRLELLTLEWALLQTICGQSVQQLLGIMAALIQDSKFQDSGKVDQSGKYG